MPVTGDVSYIVELALGTIERPYPPDVTDCVCLAIQNNPGWQQLYEDIVAEKGRHAVNSTIGRTVLRLTNLRNSGLRRAARSTLIGTYTVLV